MLHRVRAFQCASGACRTGLQLAPGAGQTTRTWIVYNKPKVASYTHAGMLMGLGLTGTPLLLLALALLDLMMLPCAAHHSQIFFRGPLPC